MVNNLKRKKKNHTAFNFPFSSPFNHSSNPERNLFASFPVLV
ncbi:unnamed protein product [Rhodiola kirilowii]